MKSKKFYALILSIACMLVVHAFAIPATAAKWSEYYREAQRAARNKEWVKAVEFFQKAIEQEAEPSARKKYGMKRIAYFPYFELGIAYIGVGDFESAHNACTRSRERGEAPREKVDECLSITTKFLSRLESQSPAVGSTPSITFTTELPSTIREHTFDIKGVAKSSHGIQQLKLSVTNLGITAINTFGMRQGMQENFWVTIPIDFGENEILLEAIDTAGQVGKQQFTVVRERSGSPKAPQNAQKLATPLPEISLPTPMPPPTPIPRKPTPEPTTNTPPEISVTSEIPTETTTDTLSLQGVASDPDGVVDVLISLSQPGSKGLQFTPPIEKKHSDGGLRYSFEEELQLQPGKNQILIEAFDAQGLKSQRLLEIVRNSPAPPVKEESSAQAAPQRRGEIYAVIIGIGEYADQRLNLQYTVNDARGLYDLLTDPAYGGVPEENIKLLLDGQATDRQIKGAIGKWLSRRANEEDTVIIYYSGHGAPEGEETYWVTHNADIDDLYTTALNNNEIFDMLSRIRAKRMITFLDSCYSAATVNRKNRTRAAPIEIPWDKFSGEGRVTLSASDGKQLSLELAEYKHGVFTYYLLEGLKGEADSNQDAIVEVDEIWDYVKHKVTERARLAGNPQTPVFQGALSAGIPLTYNMTRIRDTQQDKIKEGQQNKLAELFAQGEIEAAEHFECALVMLEAGTSNRWLDQLLAGTIKADTFNRFFKCE
ncbi:MAG: hypothetical protein GY801_00185 [bacterium]|nr:hypothetical protein [bacterium]